MISAVIPTYNRAVVLLRVLRSYLATPLISEVIIVDDASTDDTTAAVQQLLNQDPRLVYLRNEHNLGAPATRNRGALAAHGDWVLQAEDDLELGEGSVETLLAHALKAGADIIAGRRIWMRLGETKEQALARANSGSRSRRPPFTERWMDHNSHAITADDEECPLLDGAMLIRREIFDQVHYYEPYGGQSTWREESDFQISALELSFKLVFCPHAVTYHHSRASQSRGRNRLKGTLIYSYRVFRNNLAFLRRHQAYLRANHPKALILGSPLLSATAYGIYRLAWLVGAETLRIWRAKRHGAFVWE